MLLPKCANTSIKRAILKAQGRTGVQHIHNRDVFEYVSKEEAKTFPVRIAFVRDPVRRAASCYRDKFEELTDGRFLEGFERYGLKPRMGFVAFVEFISGLPDEQCKRAADHFRSQAFSLCDGETIIPNVLGRVEALGDGWGRVQEAMRGRGLNLPDLEHERRTDSASVEITPRARAFLLQRYADDVRLFGYAPKRKYEIDPDAQTRGRSICNVHREAYRIVRDQISDPTVSERLKGLIAEAFDMGKRMNAKLLESQYEE